MTDKRKLHIDITTWQGISLGAKHWYAVIQPWPADRNALPDHKEIIEKRDFLVKEQAEAWVRNKLKRKFRPDEFIIWLDYDDNVWPFIDLGFDFKITGVGDDWPFGKNKKKIVKHNGKRYSVMCKDNYTYHITEQGGRA